MALELFKIELVIRKKQTDLVSAPPSYLEIFNEYKVSEDEGRLTVDLPADWDGFKNGTIVDMLKYFNESMYIAIAYLTDDDSIVVTDLYGESIDKCKDSVDGVVLNKYVKKRLRIIKILDKSIEKFEVKGYILDLKLAETANVNPIINVLSVYSVGRDSGLLLKDFNID